MTEAEYKFTNEYTCVKCDKVVSWNTRMQSHGRCPSCGFKGKSACTVMDCNEKPVRWLKVYYDIKWWDPCSWGGKWVRDPEFTFNIDEDKRLEK